MDCRLSEEIAVVAERLARKHRQELAAAGTLVDLEELTCQIGDELARQLCENELIGRGRRAMLEEVAKCPECGEACLIGQPEPIVLQGLRGELAYNQPSYYCRHCRRSFFPDGRLAGAGGSEHGYGERFAEDGLDGQQHELCDGRRGDV